MNIGSTFAAITMSVGLLHVVVDPLITPPPIDVHEIRYDNGSVYQSRTVTSDSETFFAQWHAEVIDMRTGAAAPLCFGSGAWNYQSGHMVADMTLDVWTGSPLCRAENLLPGEYKLRASWFWGAETVTKSSDVFEVK